MNFEKLFAKQVFKNHSCNREKSLRHVAMVAKILDDNKLKTSLKEWIRTASNLIDLIQFHLIFQILGKFYHSGNGGCMDQFIFRQIHFARNLKLCSVYE